MRMRQRTGQSFESVREMHPRSTHFLSTPHFHTPQHILRGLSLPHACHLNLQELQESGGKPKKSKNDKLFVMKQVNLNFLLFNHTWP